MGDGPTAGHGSSSSFSTWCPRVAAAPCGCAAAPSPAAALSVQSPWCTACSSAPARGTRAGPPRRWGPRSSSAPATQSALGAAAGRGQQARRAGERHNKVVHQQRGKGCSGAMHDQPAKPTNRTAAWQATAMQACSLAAHPIGVLLIAIDFQVVNPAVMHSLQK